MAGQLSRYSCRVVGSAGSQLSGGVVGSSSKYTRPSISSAQLFSNSSSAVSFRLSWGGAGSADGEAEAGWDGEAEAGGEIVGLDENPGTGAGVGEAGGEVAGLEENPGTGAGVDVSKSKEDSTGCSTAVGPAVVIFPPRCGPWTVLSCRFLSDGRLKAREQCPQA